MSSMDQFALPHLAQDDEGSARLQPHTKKANEPQQQLALPNIDRAAATSNTETQQLHVSGPQDSRGGNDVKHTFSFEHLGPLVVNKDGTLSRIHNWAEMGDAERERTVRVLGKRNMLRKQAVIKDGEEEREANHSVNGIEPR